MDFTVPPCCGRNWLGWSPAKATPWKVRGGLPVPFTSKPKPATTRDWAMASASTLSLSCTAAASFCTVSGSVKATRSRTMRLIDERSGSANTASKATTTAPFSVSLSTRRATMVRGHGHCPNS